MKLICMSLLMLLFVLPVSAGNKNSRKPSQVGSPATCDLPAVKAALKEAVQKWNDGAAIGTSFKAVNVKQKPGSEGIQGTFTNIVDLEIFEAGKNSKFLDSMEVDVQLGPSGGCTAVSVK